MSHLCNLSRSSLYLSWKCIMPKNNDRTCHEPTESKFCLRRILENMRPKSSPYGCLLRSTNWLSFRITSNMVQYLFEPDLISSVFSSKYSKRPFISTKEVKGVSFFV